MADLRDQLVVDGPGLVVLMFEGQDEVGIRIQGRHVGGDTTEDGADD